MLENPAIVGAIIGTVGTLAAGLMGAIATVWAARIRAAAGRHAESPRTTVESPAGGRAPRTVRARVRLWIYVGAVAAAGLAVLTGFYAELRSTPAPTTWQRIVDLCTASISWQGDPGLLLLAWFIVMLTFSLVPRVLPQGQGKTSVTSVFDFSALLLFGPAGASVITGVTNILSNLRRGFIRPAFNFFQMVLTISSSAGIYRLLGGGFGREVRVDSGESVLAIAAAATTYFVVNSVLVAVALSLDERIGLRHAWRRNFERQLPDVFLFLLPVGTLLALVQVDFGYPGLLFMLLFVVLVQRAYEGKLTSSESRLRVLRSIAHEIDESDERTADHSLRIAAYCVRVAWELGASAKQAEDIEAAALLHNVSTLAMRRILTKNATLTEAEQDQMRLHPRIASELLRPVPGLSGVATILYCHQERPDGKGYPRGISAGIPLGAHILSAVDAFDAMIHPRPYPRPRMGADEAYAELRREAGTQFHPGVVEAVVRLHRDGSLDQELQRLLDERPHSFRRLPPPPGTALTEGLSQAA